MFPSLKDSKPRCSVDAAIAELPASDLLRPVFADPAQAALEWSTRLGVRPANHMVVMRSDVIERHPWLPEEILRCLAESRALSPLAAEHDKTLPFGVAENSSGLDLLAQFALRQGLISRLYRSDEIFAASQ